MAPQAPTEPTCQTLVCPYCGSDGYMTVVHIVPASGSAMGVDVVIQCLNFSDHQWHVLVCGVIGSSGSVVEETVLTIGPIIRPPA